MVLHNSKWDKKAKKQYMKRHGIKPEHRVQQEAQEKSKANELQGNLWRYQKHEEDSDGDSEKGLEEGSDKGEKVVDNSSIESGTEEQDLSQNELQDELHKPHDADPESSPSTGLTEHDSLNYFPEDDMELPFEEEYRKEYQELARKAALESAAGSSSAPRSDRVIQLEGAKEEFEQLKRDIEQAKLRDSIKKRFQTKKKKQLDMEEQDFDDFLEQVDMQMASSSINDDGEKTQHPKASDPQQAEVELDPSKQDFLDDLLGI